MNGRFFSRINNHVQTSLALAFDLGVGSENTPWSLSRAAKKIGLTIAPEVLARANQVIKSVRGTRQ